MNRIMKEEVMLGVFSWVHMTPVIVLTGMLSGNDELNAIVRLTVDEHGIHMGPKVPGQPLCSFSFNCQDIFDNADLEQDIMIFKNHLLNGVAQLLPDYISLTDKQTDAIRKEICTFNQISHMKQIDGHADIKSVWIKEVLPRLEKNIYFH